MRNLQSGMCFGLDQVLTTTRRKSMAVCISSHVSVYVVEIDVKPSKIVNLSILNIG